MPNKCITRNIFNDNFQGLHLKDNTSFDKQELVKNIDLWKYVLTYQCGAVKGESILIGIMDIGLTYISLCIAAAELSLKIVIVDYSRSDDFVDMDFYDPKTKLLSPIDIFLHDVSLELLTTYKEDCGKHNFFINCSNRSYNIHEDIDYTINDTEYNSIKDIFPKPSDILMRCTSSGTTGTPKIVEHTHEFLASISYRNSHKFSGDCAHIKNLNHGSSLAVFLLPSLISNNVSRHLFYDLDQDRPFDQFIDSLSKYKETLEYIMFPYPFLIDMFVDASKEHSISWNNLNVQTLSYIQQSSKDAIKQGMFKSITSIFGSNETSGPVFEATIDKDNLTQESSYYNKVDDFYDINISDNQMIEISLPIYNSKIITNDLFEIQDKFYIHRGRSDIIKINGEILDIKIINELNSQYSNSYIVPDPVKNCLYLAVWEDQDTDIFEKINQELENNFNKVHLSKSKVLVKKNFLTGIKLDNELLREYFRNYV